MCQYLTASVEFELSPLAVRLSMNEVSTLHIISCHKDNRAIYGHGHRRSDANRLDVILCG